MFFTQILITFCNAYNNYFFIIEATEQNASFTVQISDQTLMDIPTTEASNVLGDYFDKIKALVTGTNTKQENDNLTTNVDYNRSSKHQKQEIDPIAVLLSHQKNNNESLTLDEAVSFLLLKRSLELSGELETENLVTEENENVIPKCSGETRKNKVSFK